MERTIAPCRILGGSLGVTVLSAGALILILRACIFDALLAQILYLGPNSPIVETWLNNPELPTHIHFFNWTNPEDFWNASFKPSVKEMGPYTFMLNSEKVDVVWNAHNDTVTYRNIRYWRVDEKRTDSNLSDNITIFNPLTMYAATYIENWNIISRQLFSLFIDENIRYPYITKTANELVMKGYDDVLVDVANYMPFVASEIPRYDRFGFLKVLNGSTEFGGILNMKNGVGGNFDLQTFNYANRTPFYEGSCARVEGSNAELYSLNIKKTYIGVFVSELCRYMRFDFEEDVYVGGILGYKYTLGKYALDNGSAYEENSCYCGGRCLPSGVLNITTCRYNLPTYVSLPHFYQADPSYSSAVDGVDPSKNKHEMYIVLEPKTSIPLEVDFKMQFNVMVRPIEGISMYEGVSDVLFPILWMEQKGQLSPEQLTELRILLAVPCALMVLGMIVVLIGIYVLYRAYRPFIACLCKRINHEKGEEITRDKNSMALSCQSPVRIPWNK